MYYYLIVGMLLEVIGYTNMPLNSIASMVILFTVYNFYCAFYFVRRVFLMIAF